LKKAISFATEKHTEAFRKGTNVHPLEAVAIAAGITNDIEILAVETLHDVAEDTSVTLKKTEDY
jgi:(p)ppGpp synthase/HD superfamily hydrolase